MKNGRKNDSLNDASLFLDTFNQNGTLKNGIERSIYCHRKLV